MPHLEVSVKLSKVCSAAAPKGMQSCTTHGFRLELEGGREGLRGEEGVGREPRGGCDVT